MHIYSKAVATIENVDDSKFGPNGGFTAVLSTPSEDRDGDRLHRTEWQEPMQDRYPLDIDHGMSVADTVGSFHPYFEGDRLMMDAVFASTAKAQDTRALVTPDENGIRHISSVSVAFMTDKTKKSGEPQRELLNAGIVAIPSNRDAVILASRAANALKDAFSDATEGDVPDEVKTAVLETLGVKSADEVSDSDTNQGETTPKPTGVFLDVHARLSPESVKAVSDQVDALITGMTERISKAAATASGVGGDGALVQAIHDASSHLGAACPVIEVVDEGTGASSGANKSTEEVDTKDTLEAFEKALDEVLTSEESPAEAAAASEQEPAPAIEAADEKAKRIRATNVMHWRSLIPQS